MAFIPLIPGFRSQILTFLLWEGIPSPVGNPELIQIGYECGFGDKNSAGFGMVEV